LLLAPKGYIKGEYKVDNTKLYYIKEPTKPS